MVQYTRPVHHKTKIKFTLTSSHLFPQTLYPYSKLNLHSLVSSVNRNVISIMVYSANSNMHLPVFFFRNWTLFLHLQLFLNLSFSCSCIHWLGSAKYSTAARYLSSFLERLWTWLQFQSWSLLWGTGWWWASQRRITFVRRICSQHNNQRSFVRYCGQGSSLLWTPALRPLWQSNAPAQKEEGNW